MRRGRAAAAGCSPSEPGGPPEPDDPGPPLAQRPRRVVTASWSRPMAGRRRPAQDALRGLVSTCSVPCSPATQPAPWPRTSARVGPAARRPRSRDAGPAAALGWGQPRASQARPTPHHPLPSGPMQATMPPADHGARRPAAPNPGRPATRATPVQRAADTGGLSVRTPGCSGRLDTGHLDAGRPLTGWTDVPTAGPGTRTGHRPPVRRPDAPMATATATAGRGWPDPARVGASGGARPSMTALR
jgi:hypothetical protein